MMWTRVFIQYGVNDVRHSPLKMLCHPRSNRIYLTRYYETRNKQYLMLTTDIPGPKGLPLIGNLFRFMPYIGKSCLIYARDNEIIIVKIIITQIFICNLSWIGCCIYCDFIC